MTVHIYPHKFFGTVRIPASKSHTIRQLLIASLSDGVSEILKPLDSLDTRSCIAACRALGAEIEEHHENDELIKWVVKGHFNNKSQCDKIADNSSSSPIEIDVGNSGTTLYLALAIAGLYEDPIVFTGDESIQKRSAAPLLDALTGLGVTVKSANGCAPITVQGPWKGGKVVLPCPTSQYLSAILIAAPLAPADTVTEIEVPLLNELPYIEMTLSYLKAQGIICEASQSFSRFMIPGGQSWKPFSRSVPGDFSSAAFPAAAAAITGGTVTLLGLDPEDSQGDKYFLVMLREMGCDIKWGMASGERGADEQTVTISRNKPLRSGTFDLNKTPDLLPAAAAVAAYAEGDTALVNVAHARIKETDRISVMAKELAKLGVDCTEREDGLIVHGNHSMNQQDTLTNKKPAPCPLPPVLFLDGHGDHRVVMALAAAALGGRAPAEISDAEAANVTYPGFLSILTEK